MYTKHYNEEQVGEVEYLNVGDEYEQGHQEIFEGEMEGKRLRERPH